MKLLLRCLVIILLFIGCKSYKTKYPYSLADFNPELRVQLEMIVQNGGLCDVTDNSSEISHPEYYYYLSEKATKEDLYKLINCEHPVLRAFAFNCLVERKDSLINKILLNHLDDTAIITRCMGEFGEDYTYVSDYFISQSERNTKILKTYLTDEVITNHPYLSHAYFFIYELEHPVEKYYQIIKKMVKNPGLSYAKGGETAALTALSRYNKREDIPFISETLSQSWGLSDYNYDSCFSIIIHNPDTAYFKIIERFYRMISRSQSREELQNNFATGYYKLGEKYNSFLSALISFKNKKSSAIVDTIIQKKLYPFFSSRDKTYRYDIFTLLKKNECKEYKRLICLLQPEAIILEKEQAKYRLAPMYVTLDSSFDNKHDARYW